jgi:hypothetical protein
MHTQRVIFKWFAIVIASILFLQFALISPSASAQGENPPFDQFHWEDWGGSSNNKLDVSPYNVAMDSYYHVFEIEPTIGDPRIIRLKAEAAPYTIHVNLRWIYRAPSSGGPFHMNIRGSATSGPDPTADLDVQPGTTGDLSLEFDLIETEPQYNYFHDFSFDMSGSGFGSGHSTYIIAINPHGDDLDGDGLLNNWEANDTDLNSDGVIDVGPSVGSNPSIKDIYVEVDWMEEDENHSHNPMAGAMQEIVNAFAPMI